MKIIKPNYETLRRYVYEELSIRDQQALELWLLFNTDEMLLEHIWNLQQRRRRREALLNGCFKHPLKNKLKVLYYRYQGFAEEANYSLGTTVAELMPENELAFQMMSQKESEQDDLGESVIEVQPGEMHEVRVKIYERSYYSAFVVDSRENIFMIPGEKNKENYFETLHDPETYNELEPIWLDVDDDPVEVWIIFDVERPIIFPHRDEKISWLSDFLETGLSEKRKITVTKYILKVAPLEPERDVDS